LIPLSQAHRRTPLARPSLGPSGVPERELVIFTRYLTNLAPTEYVRKQYCMSLLDRGLAEEAEFSAFDRLTLGFARRGVLFARFADAYCAIFRRRGAMRRRLILLMAILEHTAPYSDRFDRPAPRSAIGLCAVVVLQSIQFALCLMIGGTLLLLAHVISLYRSSGR
jgi:hypothetical protein